MKTKIISQSKPGTASWVSIELRQLGANDFRVYEIRHLNSWGVPKGDRELIRLTNLADAEQARDMIIEQYFNHS